MKNMEITDNNPKIRSYVIVVECPFIDLGDPTYEDDTNNLVSTIKDSYIDVIEVLTQTITLLDRGPRNPYLIFELIAKVDINAIDIDEIEAQWTEMTEKILNALEGYLDKRNVEYQVL